MIITAGWDTPLNLLKEEITQKEYEGYIISNELKAEINSLDSENDAFDLKKIKFLYKKLDNLKKSSDFDYLQPNGLNEIKADRPNGPRQLDMHLNDDELLDRMHGAWSGRACGCALGKPVEAMGMSENGRKKIKDYLKKRGHWPLDYYFSGKQTNGLELICPDSQRENISCMEADDDIHYSLIGLKVLEEKGGGFKWTDVADSWNSSLPYSAICTAEKQAILNYNISHVGIYSPNPEFTRTNSNPYREWIGAQIRADGWAYCCAGNPELAAEFAWRDAHWTHTANGIYGEMFMAAVIAASFVENNPEKLIEIGLSEIPKNCRLAEAVLKALKWIKQYSDFENFMEKLEDEFTEMSAIHTVNNALISVMSLFYGEMNPDKSICISVMAGLDTDCNGATVGSIVGASAGRKNFRGNLAPALNDTIKPQVFGFQQISMKELAERTLKVHKKICSE